MARFKSHKLIRSLRETQNEKCAYCGTPIPWGVVTHLDRVVPKCSGGSHKLLTCVKCNMAKGSKSLDELIKWFLHIRSKNFSVSNLAKNHISDNLQNKIKFNQPKKIDEFIKKSKKKFYSLKESESLIRKAFQEDF